MINLIDTFTLELKEGYIIDGNHKWEYDKISIEADLIDWFISNGECFERHTDEKSIIDTITVSNTTNNQCFQNAQLVALENKEIAYYEGIVYGTKYKMTFHHGFNVKDGKAFDVTDYFNETFKSDKESNWHKEEIILYYGINIPHEFLQSYSDKLKQPNIHNPLIFEYYSFLKQKSLVSLL